MKLLFCQNCKDVINLHEHLKKCSCGKTEGKYLDKMNAEYSGEFAIPFAIDNYSFFSRIKGTGQVHIDLYDKFYGKGKIQCWLLTEGNLNAEYIKKVDPVPEPVALPPIKQTRRRLGSCGRG